MNIRILLTFLFVICGCSAEFGIPKPIGALEHVRFFASFLFVFLSRKYQRDCVNLKHLFLFNSKLSIFAANSRRHLDWEFKMCGKSNTAECGLHALGFRSNGFTNFIRDGDQSIFLRFVCNYIQSSIFESRNYHSKLQIFQYHQRINFV